MALLVTYPGMLIHGTEYSITLACQIGRIYRGRCEDEGENGNISHAEALRHGRKSILFAV